MYDRPPATDISNRLQRRFTCQSQAHPKYKDLTTSWRKKKKKRNKQSPPPNKVALGVHTQTQTNIKTCTAPKISTLTIKTLAS